MDGDDITPMGPVDAGLAGTAERMWDLFVELIPGEQRTMPAEYEVFEGDTDISASVEQTDADLEKWVLSLNLDEADSPSLESTLLHEFGHLLTLNSSQVPPDRFAPATEQAYRRIAARCAPRFHTGEGCAFDGSYIDVYVDRFWPPEMLEELERIDAIEDEDEWSEAVSEFARAHSGEFVTEYAASNPSEDIAETFAVFVLEPKPRGATVEAQKIMFFWEHPELVDLRREIRSDL